MARIREKSTGLTVYGFIVLVALSVGNLAHLLWTVWLTLEQARTGWGYSTNIEMLALMPWLIEIVFAPVLVAAGIYFGLHALRRSERALLITNIVLAAALLAQYTITNLFMWF